MHTASEEQVARDTLQQLVDKEISEEDKQKIIDSKMSSKALPPSKGFSSLSAEPQSEAIQHLQMHDGMNEPLSTGHFTISGLENRSQSGLGKVTH